MLEAAINKITEEVNKNKDNAYVQVIGEFLLNHIKNNPGESDKILVADKTILKSLDEMAKQAKKKAKNGMAMFTPHEGFEIVRKYFGLDRNIILDKVQVDPTPVVKEINIQEKPKKKFDVSLDDFLI
jgi:hypothetical protein